MRLISPRARRCAALFAELYGKATGVARGKGGSMHLIDMTHNVLGASAVVGTTIPLAVGFALAFKRTQSPRVVVAFFGDGATEEGVFTESLNFAALHKLPILFVCENNFYAIHTPVTRRWATQRLCERVETYGIPARCIEDGDVLKLRAETAAAIAALRRGAGAGLHRMPHLSLARTCRPERRLRCRLPRFGRARAVAAERSD